jgi:hypothetical protein
MYTKNIGGRQVLALLNIVKNDKYQYFMPILSLSLIRLSVRWKAKDLPKLTAIACMQMHNLQLRWLNNPSQN